MFTFVGVVSLFAVGVRVAVVKVVLVSSWPWLVRIGVEFPRLRVFSFWVESVMCISNMGMVLFNLSKVDRAFSVPGSMSWFLAVGAETLV